MSSIHRRDGCACVEWRDPIKEDRITYISYCHTHRPARTTGKLTEAHKQKIFDGLLPFIKVWNESRNV